MVPGSFPETPTAPEEELKKLRFHNYIPRTEDLRKYCEEVTRVEEVLQQVIRDQEKQLTETNRKFGDPSLDLDNLVPRKGNWDMKRSLGAKLERLERRTQRAILEIVRAKLEEEKNLIGVAESVGASSDEE